MEGWTYGVFPEFIPITTEYTKLKWPKRFLSQKWVLRGKGTNYTAHSKTNKKLKDTGKNICL